MKWLRTLIIFDKGDVISSPDWKAVHESYVRSIASVQFPEDSGTLTLRRKLRRPDKKWNRNGVGYLRKAFLDHIVTVEGWKAEVGFDVGQSNKPPILKSFPDLKNHAEPITSEFGGFDLVTTSASGMHIAIEWESGNISSSHRSMNKLAIALAAGKIQAGVLIVPSRVLYEHLTDRIGNIGELSGYLDMWNKLETRVERGLLAVTVVEHDFLTDDVDFPYLPTGNDGRAAEGRAKE